MRFKKTKWGWWAVILDRKHFKVKLLRFKKDGECSMQKHNFRHELWCWLSGKGVLDSNNGRLIYKAAGDYASVPMQSWHQFKSFEKSLVLEIQYGSSCEEGDIERL